VPSSSGEPGNHPPLRRGTLLSLEMIKAGFAHEYTNDAPYRYQQQFKDAERAAADSGAGLWASNTCGGDTTRPAGG